jgi:hypothetical protein
MVKSVNEFLIAVGYQSVKSFEKRYRRLMNLSKGDSDRTTLMREVLRLCLNF